MCAQDYIVSRYSARARAYEAYRWHFHRQAIADLLQRTGLGSGAIVADIGAGSGMSSLPFLQEGCQVHAVEPSASMRRLAEKRFAANPRFHSLNSSAAKSGLPPAFTDLIVVGRALHWFPQAEAKREFARISKPGGWLAVMAVQCEDQKILNDVHSAYQMKYGWDRQASKFNRKTKPLSYFFDDQGYRVISRNQVVHETWSVFLGRILTMAAAPAAGDDNYERFVAKLKEVFAAHAPAGRMTIPVATWIKFGHPAR